MKIAIIGLGFVGKQVESLIKGHYDYLVYDPVLISSNNTFTEKKVVIDKDENLFFEERYIHEKGAGKVRINNECDLAVVCVPTPTEEDGGCDLSLVEETIQWLEVPLILIKSTVEPGATDWLKKKYGKRIVFSPEFTGESTYYNPIMKTMAEEPFIIFGGDEKDTQAMVDVFQVIKGPLCKYIQCKAIEAELAKYMENSFFATKVAFFNEFFDICSAVRVEYDRVRELFLNDPRVNRMHTSVFKDKRGFGGKCFPKDIKAIVKYAEDNGYEAKIMKQVIRSNEDWQKKNAENSQNRT